MNRVSSIYSAVRVWFQQPDTPLPAAWLRIGMASFCLWKLWLIRESVVDVYGQYGFIQWAITRGNLPLSIPHVGNATLLLHALGLNADQSLYLILKINVAVLMLLLVGIASRLTAAFAWCLDLLLMHAGAGLLYGMDYFAHIGLLFCIIMPTGDALSVSAIARRRSRKNSVAAGLTRKVLQLQMCIIYASSGYEKAFGSQWWNGEAIWRSLTLPVFNRVPVYWLAYVPWVAVVAGWSVLAIECAYGVMMWIPRVRGMWIIVTVSMHLGIALLMGMWSFGLVMVILNIAGFGYEAWSDWRTSRFRHGHRRIVVEMATQ
jgi:hypothetical protein